MEQIQDIGEFGLIDRLKRRLQSQAENVIVGIGDDAAVLRYTAGYDIVATTDALVEGVHFRADTISYHNLGYKSLAASVSDIAAMGGVPYHVLVSLAISNDILIENLEHIYDGFAEHCNQFTCSVVGGDIVKTTGPFVINVTLLGAVKQNHALLRSGAQVGDSIFVTGYVGGSAAGLHMHNLGITSELPIEWIEYMRDCHERPEPQVAGGQILSQSKYCTSCNDISDGLASELHEIATASHAAMAIDENKIPIHSYVEAFAGRSHCNALEWALYGGEDYQLVGTIAKDHFEELQQLFAEQGLAIYEIGKVIDHVPAGTVCSLHDNSLTYHKAGYNHFSRESN